MNEIILTETEKRWIKFCKGHYQDIYPFKGRWVRSFKPLFIKTYGWYPNKNIPRMDYLYCLFNKLFEIYMKIACDESGCNRQILNIFNAAFHKSIARNEKLPVERAISELCGLIQCNQIIKNGVNRYFLD